MVLAHPLVLKMQNIITAFNYVYSSDNVPANLSVRDVTRTFTTTEDLRAAMQTDARVNVDYLGNGFNTTIEKLSNVNDGVKVTVNSVGQFQISNPSGDAFNIDDGDQWDGTLDPKNVISSANGNNYLYSGLTLLSGNAGLPNTSPLASGNDFIYLSEAVTFEDSSGNTVTLPAGINDYGDNTTDAYTYLSSVANPLPDGLSLPITFPAGSILNMTTPATAPSTAGETTGAIYVSGGTFGVSDNAAGTSPADDVTISGPITLAANQSLTIPSGVKYTLNDGITSTAPAGGYTIASTTATQTIDIEMTIPAGTSTTVTFPDGTIIGGGVSVSSLATNYPTFTPAAGTTTYMENSAKELDLSAGSNYTSTDDHDLYLSVTGSTVEDPDNPISENIKFTTSMAALQGALNSGSSVRTSQNIYAASHASSIDVYDSLGSKHTVRIEFTKQTSSEWSVMVSVPEPATLNAGFSPENIVTGSIRFDSDGSLAGFSPTSLTFTANNGSTPNQNIKLDFGSLGQFDGMTSFDQQSNTSGISQDGYPGGDLSGIRIDETGTLIGSFTNGRSFGLAQVSMAKFSNNEGLESDGGNTFVQTSNSGDPIIAQAAVGGRGFVQASALEMSNVDLSRSLTQLIVIQRGFQANSKTITTSDQMLNTLLQLKQ